MASPDQDPATYFGFSDLRGFKDFLVYVYSYAPDLFPEEVWRRPGQQMNLERAFTGLRYGLDVAARDKVNPILLDQCRALVDAAFADYRAGRDPAGQLKLEEAEAMLAKVQ